MDKKDTNSPIIEGETRESSLSPNAAKRSPMGVQERSSKGGIAKAEKAQAAAREGMRKAVARRLAAGMTETEALQAVKRITPYGAWGELAGVVADMAMDATQGAPSRIRAAEFVGRAAGFLQHGNDQQQAAPGLTVHMSDAVAGAFLRDLAHMRANTPTIQPNDDVIETDNIHYLT
jgi:hypothetical protein